MVGGRLGLWWGGDGSAWLRDRPFYVGSDPDGCRESSGILTGRWAVGRGHTHTHPGYRETSSRVSEIPSLDPPALFLASQLRQLYSQAADREGLLGPRADLDA